MSDTWNTWTDKYKAEVVAMRVMGWHKGGHRISDDICKTDCWFFRDESGRFPEEQMQHPCRRYRPTDPANIAQAWAVQERILELGLHRMWGAYLEGMLPSLSSTWAVAWATPDQRCHAAVLAIEERNRKCST